MLPKVAKSRRIVSENSELKPSNSQTDTPQAMIVNEARRMSEAKSLVRTRLIQRIRLPARPRGGLASCSRGCGAA
jgi:hypothetical protein